MLAVGKAVVIAGDADERALFVELLEDIGLEAVLETVIPSGVTDPSIVLTDLGPRYDPSRSRGALRRLRERWPNVPVVLLTPTDFAVRFSQSVGAEMRVFVKDLIVLSADTELGRDGLATGGSSEYVAARVGIGVRY